MSRSRDNVVRCQADGTWDFGDLRCEGPVCTDPGRPADGAQTATSYEQGSKVTTGGRPGLQWGLVRRCDLRFMVWSDL